MVRRSVGQDESRTPVVEAYSNSTSEDYHSRNHGDLSSEDAFEDFSTSSDAVTPSSSVPSLSLRRSSALRRKSTSTRDSYERNSTYYDVSDRSSISESIDEHCTHPGHQSFPAQRWRNDQDSIKRTMSVPIAVRSEHQGTDVPAPLDIKRRTFSLEDPQRESSDIEHAGDVNGTWYVENALLHGLDPNSNQLQVYLLGVPKGQVPPEVDLPASYVVFLPGGRDGASSASPKIARYRCRYPDCEVKWRDEDEHKIHQLEHVRVHLRCQVPGCAHPGFDNNIDLVRHLQSAHGHSHQGPFKGYACAAEICPKKDKVWLKADTYRSHCDRAHPEDDVDELLERSRITLGYLDFETALRLCQLPPSR